MTIRHQVPRPELAPVTERGGLDDLVSLVSGRRWVALTGAGMSTDSGIPDYRGPSAPPSNPMMYDEFVSDDANRRRYWARSMLGWQSFGRAVPNDGHRALVDATGLAGVVTQNVDGLHEAAGSAPVVDLHGRIDRVVCLSCRTYSSRALLQQRLQQLNPDTDGYLPAGAAELDSARLRPDGDAVVERWHDFRLAACEECGGVLKPDVVFFGESARREVVASAYELVDAADALVVLGSSLTVMSGLRFVRHAARLGKPVAVINRGPTRGDDLAAVRLDAGTTETLLALRDRL